MRINLAIFHSVAVSALIMAVPGSASSHDAAPHAREMDEISIEERFAVLDLMARYGQYFDNGNAEAYSSLYTEDGELKFPGKTPESPWIIVKGRKALADFTNQARSRNGMERISIHNLGNPIMVKVGPDHIRARTPVMYGTIDLTRNNAVSILGYALYEDDIVRTPSGWRYQKRTANKYDATPIPPEFLPAPGK
ncbi:nuclear transport factor 2 family protein [Sphingobium estronivorans]|uniref:nuclear transport factor 2 family protein n=1 Tax=Sphingobium estronivorans TaxID=1577690 RepID=UPI00123B934A|nr:nuclear transport factor 2 family protein [Sphingobium estronivorans]